MAFPGRLVFAALLLLPLGEAQARVRAPSPWASALGVGRPAFARVLGLDYSDGAKVAALARILDKSKLPPAALKGASPEHQAELIRSAASQYLWDLQADPILQSFEIKELRRVQAELADAQLIAGLLPRARGLAVFSAAAEARSRLDEALFRRAERRISVQYKAWAGEVPGTRKEWGEFYREVDGSFPPPGYKDRWISNFADDPAEAFSKALRSRKGPFLERPALRWALRRRLRETEALRWAIVSGPSRPGKMAEALAVEDPFRGIEGLREYLPGLRPGFMAVADRRLDPYNADGSLNMGQATVNFPDPAGGARRDSLGSVAGRLDAFDRITTLIHEGIHQKDLGYGRGERALDLLLGDDGDELETVLTEGFTELRTVELEARILKDGFAGANPFAVEFARLARERYKAKTYQETLRGLVRQTREHGYGPYVSVVRAIARLSGGRKALEDYAASGDVKGLIAAVGEGRLKLIRHLRRYWAKQAGRKPDREIAIRRIVLRQAEAILAGRISTRRELAKSIRSMRTFVQDEKGLDLTRRREIDRLMALDPEARRSLPRAEDKGRPQSPWTALRRILALIGSVYLLLAPLLSAAPAQLRPVLAALVGVGAALAALEICLSLRAGWRRAWGDLESLVGN